MSATDQTQDTVRHQSASNDVPAVRKDLDIKNRLVAFLMLVPLVIGMLQTSFLRILLCSALMSICFEEYARVSGLVSRGGVRVMLPLFLTGIVLGLSVQYAGFPGLLSAWALSLSTIFLTCLILVARDSSSPPTFYWSLFTQATIGFIWIVLPLSSAFLLHDLPNGYGVRLIALTILTTAGGENGGLLCGYLCNSTRPFPHLSPNKSTAGYIGQVATSAFLHVIFAWVMLGNESVLKPVWCATSSASLLLTWLAMGTVIGVLAAAGDLFESSFKRSFGAKNAGTLFPGWGGLLDRLDGLLFTFPFSVFVYFTFFTHLTTG